jgi:hypothetical protein
VEAVAQALLQKGDLSNPELMELLGDNGFRPGQPKVLRSPAAPRQLPRPMPPLPAPVGAMAATPAASPNAVAEALAEAPPATLDSTHPHPAVRRPEAQAPHSAPAHPAPKPEPLRSTPAPAEKPANGSPKGQDEADAAKGSGQN